ncbi:MAG: hypothetical protein ACODAU_03815 [Myxococcota bacterium]
MPASAAAEPQVSSRLGVGGGARWADGDTDGLFDMVLRAEVLFGDPGDEHVRVGPAVDLRTASFRTIEAAGGAALLLPTWRGYPIVLTAGVGWAERRGAPDTPIFAGTFAWGYRSYNFHGAYGFGLMGYVTARTDLIDPHGWEIVAGVEIDLEFLVALPAMGIRMLFDRGAPDEPEE